MCVHWSLMLCKTSLFIHLRYNGISDCILVIPEAEAQNLHMIASSCKINTVGCPSDKADRECNKCCRSAGCDRGDCHTYNCKCKGCKSITIYILLVALEIVFYYYILYNRRKYTGCITICICHVKIASHFHRKVVQNVFHLLPSFHFDLCRKWPNEVPIVLCI
jgi:hypothetical protein